MGTYLGKAQATNRIAGSHAEPMIAATTGRGIVRGTGQADVARLVTGSVIDKPFCGRTKKLTGRARCKKRATCSVGFGVWGDYWAPNSRTRTGSSIGQNGTRDATADCATRPRSDVKQRFGFRE
jgi:hypothetical protein